MGVGQRLEIRHSQSLVMTPQLQQAIKLLQLSNLELADYCEAELERNPLLERDESAPKDGERETVEPQAKAGERADESLAREDFSKVEDLDTSAHENLYDGENASAAPAGANEKLADWSGVRGGARFEGDEDLLESAVAGGGSLKDHLEQQLAIAALSSAERLVCLALIDSVDEGGYLRADLADLAARLGTDLATVTRVLSVLQGFEPLGVGARDLAECLALQLKAKDRYDPAMAALLSRLDLVARRDMAQLTQLCGVDGEDVAEMIAEIRALNPRPGLSFGAEPVQPVVPDIFVRVGPDGGWLVELNSD